MSEQEVVLSGKAEFDQIIKSLQKMQVQFEQTQNALKQFGNQTNDQFEKSGKKVEDGLSKKASLLRRVFNQLYSDMKGLMALKGLEQGLKLSNQFTGAIAESISLSDTIRRLGGSFGLARDQFGKFHNDLARGLGDIGASSEAAAEALKGLTGTGVKGAESAKNLVTGAVTLAGMSGQKGQEQTVAGQLARALQAQGKDVNSKAAQQELIGEVTAAVQATGKGATDILGAMEQIFSKMPEDLRKSIGSQAMAQMATIAATVGPGATKAMEEFLGRSTIERQAMQAQGVDFFGKGGQIDMNKLTDFIKNAQTRIGMDPRKALQTFGFSEEAAEGLVRIGEQSDTVKKNLGALASASRDNVDAFKRSLGMLDAFKGAINTVKGRIEEWTGDLSKNVTDFLGAQVGDAAGSTAVVAGGGLIAALLAGGGLRGIGGMLMGGAKAKAFEGITGEKVQNVYVVNASEIGAAAAAGGTLAGGGGLMGKAGGLAKGALGVGAAAFAGYEVGSLLNEKLIEPMTQGTTEEGFQGNAIERLIFKMDQLIGGQASKNIVQAQKVKVEIDNKAQNLKATQKPTRGVSQ